MAGDYQLGVLSVGTNDILSGDLTALAGNLDVILGRMLDHCGRVAVTSFPAVLGGGVLGYPGCRRRAEEANRVLRAACGDRGVLLVDTGPLRGRTLVGGDHVHFTALGSLRIADMAAGALGLRVPSDVLPDAAPGRRSAADEVAYFRRWARHAARLPLRLAGR